MRQNGTLNVVFTFCGVENSCIDVLMKLPQETDILIPIQIFFRLALMVYQVFNVNFLSSSNVWIPQACNACEPFDPFRIIRNCFILISHVRVKHMKSLHREVEDCALCYLS